MTAYTSAHQRSLDAQSEPDTDDRVAALTEQLVNERAELPRHVAEALDEVIGHGPLSDVGADGNTVFANNLARALLGNRDDENEFLHAMLEHVRTYLARDASTDAEFRVSQQIAEAEEMRAEQRAAA